jgi:ABC-type nitrate/sulfonate/bicarbonate transport system substrate-binding protein
MAAQKKRKLVVVLAVTILVVIIVLSSFVYLYFQNSESKLVNVSFGDLGSDPLGLLVHVAKDQNLFTKNGLNLTIINTVTGPNTINQVQTGQIDFGVSLEYAFVANSVLKEGNLSIISSIDRSSIVFLVARTDNGVHNIADLQTKRIGLSLQQSSLFYLERFLQLNNISIQNVTLVDLPQNQWVNALTNGTVDAIAAGRSYVQQAINLLPNDTMVFPLQSSQLAYSITFSRNDWIIQHPQLIKQFLAALTQAQNYVDNHPTETKVIIEKDYNATQDYINQIWSDHEFAVSLDQSLLLAMQDEAQWLINNHLTNVTIVPKFINYVYVDGLRTVDPNAVNIIG